MYPFLFNQTWLPMYGILITLGMVICLFLNKKIIRFPNKLNKEFNICLLICLVIAFLFAKALYILTVLPQLIDGSFTFKRALQGGLVYYGGIIGGIVSIIAYTKIRNISSFTFINAIAIFLPLGQFFGRLGCFCAGCCYGIENDYFGITYLEGIPTNINTPTGIKLLPVQLFESVFCLLLFIILICLYQRKKNLNTPLYFSIYLTSYSIWRFIIEFFRGDVERGIIFNLSTSQIISLCIILSMFVFFIYYYLHNKKTTVKK